MDELKELLRQYIEDSKDIISALRHEKSADHDLLIKLDTRINDIFAKEAEILADHERRIRDVERWMWKAVGASSLISAAMATAVHLIVYKH